MNKKLDPLRVKNVTRAIQMELMNEWNKSRFEVIEPSSACNKNLDDEIKNYKLNYINKQKK